MRTAFESQQDIKAALDAIDEQKIRELCARYRKLNPSEAPACELKSTREGQWLILRDIYGRTLRHISI